MRSLIAILVLCLFAPVCACAAGGRTIKDLAPPPPGAYLPVVIDHTLKTRNLHAGQPVTASLAQTVPVSAEVSLPENVKLDGHIVSVSDTSVSILFDQLRWRGRTLPVHLRLVAAAGAFDVYNTKLPLGATDRATSNPNDWTTRQIDGDEVYLSGGSGTVYNQYSQPVGYANFSGVYANPVASGAVPRAMGPFSTTATGLHGFPTLSIVTAGGPNAPFTLAASKSNWQIRGGSAFLLEVVH